MKKLVGLTMLVSILAAFGIYAGTQRRRIIDQPVAVSCELYWTYMLDQVQRDKMLKDDISNYLNSGHADEHTIQLGSILEMNLDLRVRLEERHAAAIEESCFRKTK